MIGVIAVAVMLSTVMAGLDGYPRAAVGLTRIYSGTPTPTGEYREIEFSKIVYSATLIILAIGSFLIMYLFVTSLKLVIDIASTIMFLFAPIIALLNHRAITSPDISLEARPGKTLLFLSAIGVIWMSIFSAYYLYLRLVG